MFKLKFILSLLIFPILLSLAKKADGEMEIDKQTNINTDTDPNMEKIDCEQLNSQKNNNENLPQECSKQNIESSNDSIQKSNDNEQIANSSQEQEKIESENPPIQLDQAQNSNTENDNNSKYDTENNQLLLELFQLENELHKQQQKISNLNPATQKKSDQNIKAQNNKPQVQNTQPKQQQQQDETISIESTNNQNQIPQPEKVQKQKQNQAKKKVRKQSKLEKQFMNKVLKKKDMEIEDEIQEIDFLNTFQYKTQLDTTSNYMICSLTKNATINLFEITGNSISDPFHLNSTVLKMSLSPKVDEVLIVTFHADNIIKLSKLDNRKIKIYNNDTLNGTKKLPGGKNNPKNKDKYKYNLKYEGQFIIYTNMTYEAQENDYVIESVIRNEQNNENEQETQTIDSNSLNDLKVDFQVLLHEAQVYNDGESQKNKQKYINQIFLDSRNTGSFTAFASATIKGVKYIMLGDSIGNIYTFYRNGTYKGRSNVASNAIKNIEKSSYSNIVFTTSSSVGFFNPSTLTSIPPYCEIIQDGIIDTAFDTNYNNMLYILTLQRDIFLFELRNNDNQCKFKAKIASDLDIDSSNYSNMQLLAIRNSLILQDYEENIAIVFNTTEIQSSLIVNDEMYEVQIYSKKYEQSNVHFAVQKISQKNSYLVVSESTDSESQLSVFEILTPLKKETDILGNLRIPIIILAVVIAFGYQFWNKGSKSKKKFDSAEFDGLINKFKNAPQGGDFGNSNRNVDNQKRYN